MAAHLEGKGASVLDFAAFAQRFGPVLSYIRLAGSPPDLNQVRIDQGAADALIGCDVVVCSSAEASGTYRRGTRAVINSAEMSTGDIVRLRDAAIDPDRRIKAVEDVIGADNVATSNANAAAEAIFDDTVYANMMMLGAAWPSGRIPVSLAALMQAIVLNGAAVEKNKQTSLLGVSL